MQGNTRIRMRSSSLSLVLSIVLQRHTPKTILHKLIVPKKRPWELATGGHMLENVGEDMEAGVDEVVVVVVLVLVNLMYDHF